MATKQPFPRLLAAEIDGRCQNTRYRQTQLHQLQSALTAHIDEIKHAIQQDSGHSTEEVEAEICLALKELRAHYLPLSLEKDLDIEYRVAKGKDNPDGNRGVGIVYVVPCTHTVFFSVVSALSAAIAAGNCVIVELTTNTMALPAVLRRILPPALDADTFAISTERPEASFLEKHTLLIIQNSEAEAAIGRRSLVSPSTAKTVAIVDRTANIVHAAESLLAARFAFGGRSTYAPDMVLVHEFAMKPFVEAVMQRSSKYLAGPNGAAREKGDRPRRGGSATVLDTAGRDPGARVLVSGSEWGIVEVQDRNSSLLQKKIDEKVMVLHPVTSLDDAIDFSSTMGTLAATYAFAIPASAKYLTQFIGAHISWVNHVPMDRLIGPATPVNSLTGVTQTRYASSLLQVPRPQIVTETGNSVLVRTVLDAATGGKSKATAAAAWAEALAPLPSTKQPVGWRIGFFEQGIITGGVITLASVVGVVSTVGYYGFWMVRSYLR